MVKEKLKKVFICGDIPQHKKASEYLISKGYVPINPTILPFGLSHGDLVEIQMEILRYCDAIYLLKGWSTDKTYYRQYVHAVELGFEIIRDEEVNQ